MRTESDVKSSIIEACQQIHEEIVSLEESFEGDAQKFEIMLGRQLSKVIATSEDPFDFGVDAYKVAATALWTMWRAGLEHARSESSA